MGYFSVCVFGVFALLWGYDADCCWWFLAGLLVIA